MCFEFGAISAVSAHALGAVGCLLRVSHEMPFVIL